jgi:protein-tyrosine phosphatase
MDMKWMVIYGYKVPGEALNLSSTELPRPVTMGIFLFMENFLWYNRESNPGPYGQ